MTVEDQILRQLGHDPAQVLGHAQGRDELAARLHPAILKIANEIGAMRRATSVDHRADRLAELVHHLIIDTRPRLRRAGLSTDEWLALIDREAETDRLLLGPGAHERRWADYWKTGDLGDDAVCDVEAA